MILSSRAVTLLLFLRLLVGFSLQRSDRLEEGVLQGLLRRDPSELIIDKYLLEQIDAVLSHAAIVVLIQVAAQALPISILDHFFHAFGHLKLVDAHVVVQCLRA